MSLGSGYPNPLRNKHFNPQYWARSVEFLRGEYDYRKRKAGDEKQRRRTRLVRNQAFTHLKEGVDQVCARAQVVFKADDTGLKIYRSTYF